jgi:predicted nucleotidyltransferase
MRPDETNAKVLKLLFDFPTREFHIREISRILKVSAPAVSKAVTILEKESFLIHNKGFVSKIYAKKDENFRGFKRISNLEEIYKSKLIPFLTQALGPITLVLYGSYSKGEDDENSEACLAILDYEKGKKIDLKSFEKQLNRKINLKFINLKNAPSELKETLINGVVLIGKINLKEVNHL